jgi:WD40 repeat protein
MVFSPDEKYLATAGKDASIKIWSTVRPKENQTIQLPPGSTTASLAFISDGSHLAAATNGDYPVDTITGLPKESQSTAAKNGYHLLTWDLLASRKALEGVPRIISVGHLPSGTILLPVLLCEFLRLLSEHPTMSILECDQRFPGRVYPLGLSPDARCVVGSLPDSNLKIWEQGNDSENAILRGHTKRITCAAFSNNGLLIATGSEDQTIRIWDRRMLKVRQILGGHKNNITSIAFSSDDQLIASSSLDTSDPIRLWNTASGKELARFRGHGKPVRCIAFSPDGKRLASGADDKTIRIWDTATQVEILTLGGQLENVVRVIFSPSGKMLASAGADNKIWLWQTD